VSDAAKSVTGAPREGGDRRPVSDEQRKQFWMDRFRRARTDMDKKGETAATPPPQPPAGPGGKRYLHARVTSTLCGSGPTAYWAFEPAAPSPASAPVIVLLHGWGGTEPMLYGMWIDHLVMRGNVVLFPVYQESIKAGRDTVLGNCLGAIRDAMAASGSAGPTRRDWERYAISGHSAGGVLAAQIAAASGRERLPRPKAVMAVHPSRGHGVTRPLPRANLLTIAPETLALIVIGKDDEAAGDADARAMFGQTPQIPRANKDFVAVVSDFHGTQPLVANHVAPLAPRVAYAMRSSEISTRSMIDFARLKGSRVDALNYYGYWKLLDALCDAAFYGANREYALGNTPQQRFMGKWSDDAPVNELVICPPQP